jgi:uncharacterized protein (TIGR00303 family)
MIHICTGPFIGAKWLKRYRRIRPNFCCVMGFTETGLYPGISAAGKTIEARKTTAIADLEFLVNGNHEAVKYPLPPLSGGVSPVVITRAIASELKWPMILMNAGSMIRPPFPCVDLGGVPAKCLSTGNAMTIRTVLKLFQAGVQWGEQLAQTIEGYIILSECVVGGTTTALGLLSALGYDAQHKVNSSHQICNHNQKWRLVKQGLGYLNHYQIDSDVPFCFRAVASMGDPMQIAVAGLAMSLSQHCGVMLAGGTQMLAVYALIKAIAQATNFAWNPDEVVVGTTPWVTNDPSGDTIALAKEIGDVTLMTSELSFKSSSYPELQAYDQGFVKEGVGAGGSAVAAYLHQDWSNAEILKAIEARFQDTYPTRPCDQRHYEFAIAS